MLMVALALVVSFAIISIYSMASAFELRSSGSNETFSAIQSSLHLSSISSRTPDNGLEQKLTQILCNSNEKSIFIEFDDTLKSGIVDRVINRITQCSSNSIPVIVLHQ